MWGLAQTRKYDPRDRKRCCCGYIWLVRGRAGEGDGVYAFPTKGCEKRADERTRTADLLITSELLYLLSYVGPFRAQSIS